MKNIWNFLRRKQQVVENDDGTELPSWRDMLECHGPELWTIRARVFSPLGTIRSNDCTTTANTTSGKEHRGDERQDDYSLTKERPHPPCVALSIYSNDTQYPSQRRHRRRENRQQSKNRARVMVMGCPHLFQKMEEQKGIDKPSRNKRQNGDPRPLTDCTGDEWVCGRRQVKSSFHNLPQRSLQAVSLADLTELIQQNTISENDVVRAAARGPSAAQVVIDLKQVAVDASVIWVGVLFQGKRNPNLEETTRLFWQASRSIEPLPKDMFQQRRKAFVESLSYEEGGVLQSLGQSGLSPKEVPDNAVNAMIAALDAAQALIFWTLWNLCRDTDCWKAAQSVALGDSSIHQTDLDGLAAFKKAATEGREVDYSRLSYLGRALCETVRVFPPVWTLPRTWPNGDEDNNPGIHWSKLEVATVNGATDYRDWDPNGPVATGTAPTSIASFGLGRRHCPAGTAALYAVYQLLIEFLSRVETLEECQPDHALDSAYLLPTLSVVGVQPFLIQWKQGYISLV